MVSQLTVTFGYHALCVNKSKANVIAVSSKVTQSLFINVLAFAKGFTTCYLCRR